MQIIFTVVHVLLCAGLVGFILVQHGKGADMGAAFGSGASASVFGSQGSGNFLTRTTSLLAAGFFMTSLTLAYFAVPNAEPESIIGTAPPVAEEVVAPTAPTSELPAVVDEQPAAAQQSETNKSSSELPPAK